MSFKKFMEKSVKLRPDYEENLLVVYLPWKEQFDILIGKIPPFFMDIYTNCNGTEADESKTELYDFIPNFRLLKIQVAMDLQGKFVNLYSLEKDTLIIPFLASKNGEYICYRNHNDVEDFVYISDGKITKIYDSIDSFWNTLCQGYDEKIYGIDFKSSLSADQNKVRDIAKQNNPNSDFWN